MTNEVPVRLRPWPARLVNSYRVFRTLPTVGRIAAARHAWAMAFIGTPPDRARAYLVDAWSNLVALVAATGMFAPLILVMCAIDWTFGRLVDAYDAITSRPVALLLSFILGAASGLAYFADRLFLSFALYLVAVALSAGYFFHKPKKAAK